MRRVRCGVPGISLASACLVMTAVPRAAFFELESRAGRLRQRLAAEYPDRADAFRVVPVECNVTIAAALADRADLNWAPWSARAQPAVASRSSSAAALLGYHSG